MSTPEYVFIALAAVATLVNAFVAFNVQGRMNKLVHELKFRHVL